MTTLLLILAAILALANWPRVDANRIGEAPAWARVNRAVGYNVPIRPESSLAYLQFPPGSPFEEFFKQFQEQQRGARRPHQDGGERDLPAGGADVGPRPAGAHRRPPALT